MRPKWKIYFKQGTEEGDIDKGSLKLDFGFSSISGCGNDRNGDYLLANTAGSNYIKAGHTKHHEVDRVVPNKL